MVINSKATHEKPNLARKIRRTLMRRRKVLMRDRLTEMRTVTLMRVSLNCLTATMRMITLTTPPTNPILKKKERGTQ